jgi:hypothetical protein
MKGGFISRTLFQSNPLQESTSHPLKWIKTFHWMLLFCCCYCCYCCCCSCSCSCCCFCLKQTWTRDVPSLPWSHDLNRFDSLVLGLTCYKKMRDIKSLIGFVFSCWIILEVIMQKVQWTKRMNEEFITLWWDPNIQDWFESRLRRHCLQEVSNCSENSYTKQLYHFLCNNSLPLN